jgi:hypothetical protein
MHISYLDYSELLNGNITISPGEPLVLIDHLEGFDSDLKNPLLDLLAKKQCTNPVYLQYYIDSLLKNQYKTLNISFSTELQNSINFLQHKKYNIHPEINYKNFVCSFNGTAHIGRKLLVSILQRFNWFDPDYSSKNFSYSSDIINGHISDLSGNKEIFFRKFFIADDSECFFQTKYSFGHDRFNHRNNIYTLENKLTQSFLHIVSETMSTSYYPFVTEKFLYSIVTRGLFLAYAQPGWHNHLEKFYGFKRYTELFDYRFDTIQNPIERLVELMSMISKFSTLSVHDWHDLYLLEQHTIEYNYDHYFTGRYLDCLKEMMI